MARLGLRTLRKPNTDGFIEELKKEIPIDTDSKGLNEIQTVSIQTVSIGSKSTHTDADTVSKGLNEIQTVSVQTVSIGSKSTHTDADTVSKKPSLTEINLLENLLKKQGSSEVIQIKRAELAFELQITLAGLKTALVRLKKKGYIDLVSCQKGRYTGFTSYRLTEQSYKYLATQEAKHSLGFKRLQKASQTVSNDSLYSNNKLNTIKELQKSTFTVPPNLTSIGVVEKNLENILKLGLLTENEIQQSLEHYSYDIQAGIKANLMLFMGILRKGTVYISQKYTQESEKLIEIEISRIQQAKELEEQKLKSELYLKFEDYKNNHPEFLEEVKNSLRFQVSENILENIAFQKFCELNNA